MTLPGLMARRFDDPGWDRDGSLFSEINDRPETLPKKYLIEGGEGRGETPSCLSILTERRILQW